jgi:poly(3-hydroxybutyrate) depolymerase
MSRALLVYIARIGLLASLGCLPLMARAQSGGCGAAGLSSGTYALAHHGLIRNFRLYVPPQYRRELPARLVFLFHGWGGNESEFLGNAQVIEAARTHGYILVAPRGLGAGPPDHRNNSWTFRGSATGMAGDAQSSGPAAGAPAICDATATPDYRYPSCERGVARNSCSWTQCQDDDVLFTLALAHYLEARLCIDTAHVFAAGGSNGGMFTWELGQNPLSALTFRAIAPIIGLPHRGYLSGPGKPGTMPVIIITGFNDPVVPPGAWDSDVFTTTSNDKDRFYYTSATAISKKWAAAAGCNTSGKEHPVALGTVPEADCRSFCPTEGAHWPAVVDCRAKMAHDYGLPWSWNLILDFFDRN